MKMSATKRSKAIVRGFIGEQTRCIRFREQILWFFIFRLFWRYLVSFFFNLILICGYWIICVCFANWWVGQKWLCFFLKRLLVRKLGLILVRKQLFIVKNVCVRVGCLVQLVSEICGKDLGCYILNCRRRGCLNRKVGVWKKCWLVVFLSWIWFQIKCGWIGEIR